MGRFKKLQIAKDYLKEIKRRKVATLQRWNMRNKEYMTLRTACDYFVRDVDCVFFKFDNPINYKGVETQEIKVIGGY